MDLKSKNLFSLLLSVYCISCYSQEKPDYILVPGGEYIIGKENHILNPLRKIKVDSFFIAPTEITNLQFEKFVFATSYQTDAERLHNAMIFEPGLKEFEWMNDTTAYWRFPNGISRGSIENKMDHPVTCISYSDAIAYCRWAGVRLPSLNEWEIACRAETVTNYFFGNDSKQINRYANIWYGKDHLTADSSDGYMCTSPVASFAPNQWGLYDMYGNVFEFCSGKLKETEPSTVVHARGGSWWCSKNSCNFFNSYDIGRVNIHASFSNQGFRVVRGN